MLNYWNLGCWFTGTEGADLIELRMMNYLNWGCWWGCWFIGTHGTDLIELSMLNACNWGCLFIGTKDTGFIVFRTPYNATEDADLLEFRVLI